LDASDCEWADLILAAESDNVFFVRTNFPQFADKAVQLAQFVRFAPLDGNIAPMLRVVLQHEPSKEFNVSDPAGGDQAIYDECARQLWDLARAFVHIVRDERVS
jgi:protein-tyrosine-phosphatase